MLGFGGQPPRPFLCPPLSFWTPLRDNSRIWSLKSEAECEERLRAYGKPEGNENRICKPVRKDHGLRSSSGSLAMIGRGATRLVAVNQLGRRAGSIGWKGSMRIIIACTLTLIFAPLA